MFPATSARSVAAFPTLDLVQEHLDHERKPLSKSNQIDLALGNRVASIGGTVLALGEQIRKLENEISELRADRDLWRRRAEIGITHLSATEG